MILQIAIPTSFSLSAGIDQTKGSSSRGTVSPNKNQEIDKPSQRTKGEVVHQGINPFFQWLNGKLTPKNPENPTLYESTSGYLQNITKTVWSATPIIQAFGLVNKRAHMFARAIYGTCWAIVYSCLRPFKADAELLTDEGATKPIPDAVRTFDRANEHFRLGMGSVVSVFYGSGAVGMLWNAITGNEEGFESASKLYQKGMLDQNQVFASMNTGICLKRKYNANQLPIDDRTTGNIKSTAELIDSVLFLPNVIARGIDTVDFFGWHVGDGLGKIVNALGYFSYGTWAARFGFVKGQEFEGAGALEPKNKDLTGSSKTIDDALYNTQKYGAETFKYSLPVLSFISSGLELFGLRDLAKQVFSFEGIIERLNPTISAWCLRNPVVSGLIKSPKVEPHQSAQIPDIQSPEIAAEVKPEAEANPEQEVRQAFNFETATKSEVEAQLALNSSLNAIKYRVSEYYHPILERRIDAFHIFSNQILLAAKSYDSGSKERENLISMNHKLSSITQTTMNKFFEFWDQIPSIKNNYSAWDSHFSMGSQAVQELTTNDEWNSLFNAVKEKKIDLRVVYHAAQNQLFPLQLLVDELLDNTGTINDEQLKELSLEYKKDSSGHFVLPKWDLIQPIQLTSPESKELFDTEMRALFRENIDQNKIPLIKEALSGKGVDGVFAADVFIAQKSGLLSREELVNAAKSIGIENFLHACRFGLYEKDDVLDHISKGVFSLEEARKYRGAFSRRKYNDVVRNLYNNEKIAEIKDRLNGNDTVGSREVTYEEILEAADANLGKITWNDAVNFVEREKKAWNTIRKHRKDFPIQNEIYLEATKNAFTKEQVEAIEAMFRNICDQPSENLPETFTHKGTTVSFIQAMEASQVVKDIDLFKQLKGTGLLFELFDKAKEQGFEGLYPEHIVKLLREEEEPISHTIREGLDRRLLSPLSFEQWKNTKLVIAA